MALQKTFEDRSGVIHEDAYFRINKIEIDTKDKVGLIVVMAYKDGEAKNDKSPIFGENYCVDTEAYEQYFSVLVFEDEKTNHIKQAYLYLKTLENFTNSLDV